MLNLQDLFNLQFHIKPSFPNLVDYLGLVHSSAMIKIYFLTEYDMVTLDSFHCSTLEESLAWYICLAQ